MLYRKLLVLALAAAAAGCGQIVSSSQAVDVDSLVYQSSAEPEPGSGPDDVFDGNTVEKTDDEWRKLLTPEQFHILREAGTERAFANEYNNNHEKGDYYCAACHLKLFSSATKFESGTGWPSFYAPVNKKNVIEQTDTAFGITRTEVLCARCRSHLGHVFDDGPKPTGLRYCMNSAAMKFESASKTLPKACTAGSPDRPGQ
jgi:peptide-methionine (R)-S-oxide reductase